jgi:hypothetical protein
MIFGHFPTPLIRLPLPTSGNLTRFNISRPFAFQPTSLFSFPFFERTDPWQQHKLCLPYSK